MIVYKYAVPSHTSAPVIWMPLGAQILSVAEQVTGPSGGKDVFIWALVNPDAPERKRSILVIPTGHSITLVEFTAFIGTLHLRYADGSNRVLHFFDAGEIL